MAMLGLNSSEYPSEVGMGGAAFNHWDQFAPSYDNCWQEQWNTPYFGGQGGNMDWTFGWQMPPPPVPHEGWQRNRSHNTTKSKRRFCTSFPDVSECRRGAACAFAHSREEISVPLLSVAEENQEPHALTDDFFMYQYKTHWCPIGVQHDWHTCVYAHNYQDARRPVTIGYGARLCPYWDKKDTGAGYEQRCPLGLQCPYSHGAKEQLYHPHYFKTVVCRDLRGKACPRHNLCAFYHHRNERRSTPVDKVDYHTPLPQEALPESWVSEFLSPPFHAETGKRGLDDGKAEQARVSKQERNMDAWGRPRLQSPGPMEHGFHYGQMPPAAQPCPNTYPMPSLCSDNMPPCVTFVFLVPCRQGGAAAAEPMAFNPPPLLPVQFKSGEYAEIPAEQRWDDSPCSAMEAHGTSTDMQRAWDSEEDTNETCSMATPMPWLPVQLKKDEHAEMAAQQWDDSPLGTTESHGTSTDMQRAWDSEEDTHQTCSMATPMPWLPVQLKKDEHAELEDSPSKPQLMRRAWSAENLLRWDTSP